MIKVTLEWNRETKNTVRYNPVNTLVMVSPVYIKKTAFNPPVFPKVFYPKVIEIIIKDAKK